MTEQITGGSVEYSRTTRPADFESKSAKVTFVIGGENPSQDGVVNLVDYSIGLAMTKVHTALGIIKPQDVQRSTANDPEIQKAVAAKEAKDKPKSDKAAAATAALAKAGAPATASGDDVVTTQPAAGAIDDVPAQGDLVGDASPPTDAQLQDEITKANAATDLKLTPKIKELIATYAGEGKRSHQIPAEKRKAFLKELHQRKDAHLAAQNL